MPDIDSYPTVSAVSTLDRVIIRQTDGDGSLHTRRGTIAQLLDGILPIEGGELTGPLTLEADPTTPLGAATKEYVDAETTARSVALATETTARQSGDSTNATAIAAVQTTANGALSRAGGAMTGAITLAADPTTTLQPATKQYVDAGIAAETTARAGAVTTETTARAAGDATNATAAAAAQSTASAALPVAGGTMTGAIVLAADGSVPLHPATVNQLRNRLPGYDVTQLGVIDDGQKGYFTASWTSGAAGLTIASGTTNITIANTGPGGVALVTFPGASSGNMLIPSREWRGFNIAIDGAGAAAGTLVAKVVDVYFDNQNNFTVTAQLDRAAPTVFSNVSHQFACPCFVAADVGKGVFLLNGGQVFGGGGNPIAAGPGVPFASTILTYNTPYSVTLAANIPGATRTAQPGCLIAWGTDNSAGIRTAGKAARAGGYRELFFPGLTSVNSTGMFFACNYISNLTSPVSAADYDASLSTSMLRWVLSGATSFITPVPSGAGHDETLLTGPIPYDAPPPSRPRKTIVGRRHFPRCASITGTLVVLIVGDSWSNRDPTGDGNGVMWPFIVEFQRQNPTKTVIPVFAGINGLTWAGLVQTIGSKSTITVGGLGTVTPDLVVLAVTGCNDAQNIVRNDILTCINIVRSWSTTNGFPPDVLTITGMVRRTSEAYSAGGQDYGPVAQEFGVGMQRSLARRQGIALFDIGTFTEECLNGFSPTENILRHVPSLPAAAIGPNTPYNMAYRTRNFMIAFELVAATGSGFWTAAGTLQLLLSQKPDNRLIISVDGSNNLTVMATAWGYTVSTTCTLANGDTALTTSGQTSIVTGLTPAILGTNGIYQVSGNNFVAGMVGQCFYQAGMQLGGTDGRTFIFSQTNPNNAFAADATLQAATNTTAFYGGQMFLPNDAGTADIVIAGAGTTLHPLTGANSLVTKVTAVGSKTAATLGAPNSQASISGAKSVFLGGISVAPTYHQAVAAGSDSGANPVLIVEKKGTHIRVYYVLGGASLGDIRSVLQTNETVVWEGEVECAGGPFSPRLWAGGTVTVQPVDVWIDERDMKQSSMTGQEAFGNNDPSFSYKYGGDGGHPSSKFLPLLAEIAGVQDLST